MGATPERLSCPGCGSPLATAALGGFCPKCVARVALGPELPPQQSSALAVARLGSFAEYQLEGEVARGGMGVIFKARRLKLNRTFALKMILAGQYAGPLELRRFRAEAEAGAHLQHPNIVTIHEVGERDGLPYFSMEYVEGQTLARSSAPRMRKPACTTSLELLWPPLATRRSILFKMLR